MEKTHVFDQNAETTCKYTVPVKKQFKKYKANKERWVEKRNTDLLLYTR